MKKRYALITQITTTISFILFVALFILYEKGYYDFTFIERPKGPNVSVSDSLSPDQNNVHSPENNPNDSDNTDKNNNNTSDSDNSKDDNPSSDDNPNPTGETAVTYETVTSAIADANTLKKQGYKLSDEIFSKDNFRLAVVSAPNLTKDFSNSKETIELPVREYDKKMGGYETFLQTIERDRAAVKLYMGYIIYDDKKGGILYDSEFNVLANNFNQNDYKPAYFRSAYGYPLFEADGSYRYISDVNTFTADPQAAFYNGIRADLPEYYTMPEAEISPYYDKETKKWGYYDTVGGIVIKPEYLAAYQLNENGLAAVLKDDRRLVFINRNNGIELDLSGEFLYQNTVRAVAMLYEPDTFGLESLGMFRFDHGLTRVRRHVYEKGRGHNYVLDDRDMLIDEKGNEYILPAGFNLVSYSDGIALLEKDGLYGYFDYAGRWVAKPEYTYATPFVEGLAVIGQKDGKKALIDTQGNIILDYVFDYISMPSSGLIATYEINNGWNIYYKMTKG